MRNKTRGDTKGKTRRQEGGRKSLARAPVSNKSQPNARKQTKLASNVRDVKEWLHGALPGLQCTLGSCLDGRKAKFQLDERSASSMGPAMWPQWQCKHCRRSMTTHRLKLVHPQALGSIRPHEAGVFLFRLGIARTHI